MIRSNDQGKFWNFFGPQEVEFQQGPWLDLIKWPVFKDQMTFKTDLQAFRAQPLHMASD